ncbi:MAG: phosphatase PAP2 family protein [Bacteroidales bacterium]|nr:phosphatase PAP2 family protein [Bacteroidales bacterium]MBR5532815.1 phosphatase PAP2 family protein [Bacteroidales bacterium]
MLETLIELDKAIFLIFNSHHTLYFDQVMWVVTGRFIWIPLILSILYVFFKKNYKEGLLVVLILAVTVLLCDQIASGLFKPLFERYRPSRDPEFSQYVTLVNGYLGGRYGFISSHAANAFGIAIFTIQLFRNKLFSISVILWAILSCYSRLYLGVHYPGDILCGILVGSITGYLCYKIYEKLHDKIFFQKTIPYRKDKNVNVIISVLYITYIFILIFAPLINFKIK